MIKPMTSTAFGAALVLVLSAADVTSAWAQSPSRPCAARGPTPLEQTDTTGLRAAFPLAFQGNVVVSIGTQDRLTILDLATGEQRSVPSGISGPHELMVSPDGRWAVAADFGRHLGNWDFSGRELGIYELPGRLAHRVHLGEHRGPHDIVFTGPERFAVTTQTSQHVVEVDAATGRMLGATSTGGRGSHTLTVTGDGRTAFTGNQPEPSLSRLDLASRRLVWKRSVGIGRTEGVATTPDGGEVWMGFGDEMGAVLVVDGNSGAVLDTIPGFRTPERITMSGDGRFAVITDFGCRVTHVADVRTRRLLGPIAGLEGAGIAKVLPDNRTAIVVMLNERTIAMVDLVGRRVVARHELGGARPDAAAWGPAQR